MTYGAIEHVLTDRLTHLHEDGRLRVWSIVLSLFSDAIVPRGGEFGLSDIQVLTDRMGITPSALRAALSRLTRDGALVRDRMGRRSFYRLSAAALADQERAEVRVYAPTPPHWTGEVTVALAPPAATGWLLDRGFVELCDQVHMIAGRPVVEPRSDMLLLTSPADRLPGWVKSALSPDWQADRYRALISGWSPLVAPLDAVAPDPLDAMVLRTLVIHDWRRLVLKVNPLPAVMRVPGWPGPHARALVQQIYSRLEASSERWLDERKDARRAGDLPQREPRANWRFREDLQAA